jgi:galactokinase
MYDPKPAALANQFHQTTYGTPATVQAYAPGRIEILGNHTDYNAGTTLSTAINRGTAFVLSPSETPGVNLSATNLNQSIQFDPTTKETLSEEFQWANYVKGVFHLLRSHGIEVDRVNCTFAGSIPMGAGLSSSAALEVATAFALIDYVGGQLDPITIAKVAQAAEQQFAGCNCGLLDQFSSIFGVPSGLIYSDFRTLETASIELPADARFIMINPHIQHALAESPYNERRISCEKAAAQFNKWLDHPVEALRDVSWEEFIRYRDQIDPEAAQRAEHVIAEITRVAKSIEYLEQQDLNAFGQLLYDSHETSRIAFENSCPELDCIVEAAREAGAPGARLSGGGWGGSVVVLAREPDAEAICQSILKIGRSHGLDPSAEITIPSAGAQIITPSHKQEIQ